MSAQEPVIAVSNETSESERVDSSVVPPSEVLAAKDVPSIVDSSPAEPVTELPTEPAQTASDDTTTILPKHDTNIPDATPTNLNGSADGVGATPFVNEPDNTVAPVEILKVDDANEVAEDEAPIKHGVNGDVEGVTSGGSEGADLDLADQTLVEDLSQDADSSVIREVTDVPVKVLDTDAERIVVEDDGGDKVPEPVTVTVKDVEEDVSPDITPVPEVAEPVTIPIEEETPAAAKLEPGVENEPESVDVEPPIVESVEVDAAPDAKEVDPVVDLGKDEPASSEEPVAEKEETEIVSTPALPSDEPVVEPVESNPAESADDVPSIAEGTLSKEPESTPAEPVIADLDAAREVEPHAAELGVAPELIEIVTVTEDVPESLPEEPTNVREPVIEPEAASKIEPKGEEITPPVAESTPEPGVEEPVIEDLDEAKKVEEHAAQTEVAPIVAGSNIEEPVEDPVVGVLPVPKEGDPLLATNGHCRSDGESAEPEEGLPEVAIPEGSTESVPETAAPGDVKPQAEEPPATVEPVNEGSEEATTLVKDEEVSPEVEGDPTTTAAVEPEPVKEVEVTELENPEGIPPVEVSSAPEPISEPSSEVKEVPVGAEPVIVTPLPTFAIPEHEVEPVVTEDSLAANFVEDVTPDVATEEKPTADEPEVPAPEPQGAEETAPAIAILVEEPEPAHEVAEEEVVALSVSEPTVGPPAEEGSTPDVPESKAPAPEPVLEEVPPVELESVIEPQELETVQPLDPAEEKPSIDEAELEEAPPAISESVEAAQDVPTSDVLQEEAKRVEGLWTPSYSVKSLGGGLDTTEPADEEAVKPTTTSEPPVDSAPRPEIVTLAEEPTVVELEVIADDPQKSLSWTPSYSTTVQGSSPRLESQAVLGSGPEAVQTEPEDISNTIQGVEPVPGATVPVEVLAPQIVSPAEEPATDDSEHVPPEPLASVDVPSAALDAEPVPTPAEPVVALGVPDETPTAEVEVEVPPVEKVEATETPQIITPVDEEPVEPATATETTWAQSYSVTSQPGSPRVSPKAELKELEPEPQPAESVQETPAAAPIVELANVPETVVTPAVEDEHEDVAEPVPEEESRPTWTQSYSVTSQPGSPRTSPKQVPEEVPETEEVKPSWTQSYSVTSQPGSPRVPPTEDLQEPAVEPVVLADEPITVVTPPIEDATPAPVEAEAPERPKSPWAPSYSVTTLDGQTEQTPVDDAEPEPEVVSVPKSFIGEAPEPEPEADAPITDASATEQLAAKDEQPEQPRSPWTPSYSVTTPPGSAPAEGPGPDSVADKPSVEVEASGLEPVEVTKAVEHPKEHGTTSDVFEVHEVVAQLAVQEESQFDIKTPEPAPPQLDLPTPDATVEVEKSSWAPSYSVTQLLGASPKVEVKEELPAPQDPAVDELGEVESTPSHYTHTRDSTTTGTTRETTKDDGPLYFPGVPESLDEAPARPKLDLLTTVDPSNISKISPRTRYESSTSSRLFPGAWLSSPKSAGEESLSRTSMEEATGEFIFSKSSVAPNEPAVAEAPEDLPASPITPATPTTKKDKKWRMCEIM